MVSQSVTEGVWRFVLERNQIQPDVDRPAVAAALVEQKIISTACAEAFGRIWHSFRNDAHHMNASVSAVPFRELARRNMVDLAAIESEIFASHSATESSSQFNRAIGIFKRTVRRQRSFGIHGSASALHPDRRGASVASRRCSAAGVVAPRDCRLMGERGAVTWQATEEVCVRDRHSDPDVLRWLHAVTKGADGRP